jgi:hypothetical protein
MLQSSEICNVVFNKLEGSVWRWEIEAFLQSCPLRNNSCTILSFVGRCSSYCDMFRFSWITSRQYVYIYLCFTNYLIATPLPALSSRWHLFLPKFVLFTFLNHRSCRVLWWMLQNRPVVLSRYFMTTVDRSHFTTLRQINLYYDRRSVGQSGLVSGTHMVPATNSFSLFL